MEKRKLKENKLDKLIAEELLGLEKARIVYETEEEKLADQTKRIAKAGEVNQTLNDLTVNRNRIK